MVIVTDSEAEDSTNLRRAICLYPEQVTIDTEAKLCWLLLMATFPIIYLIYINLHHEIIGENLILIFL